MPFPVFDPKLPLKESMSIFNEGSKILDQKADEIIKNVKYLLRYHNIFRVAHITKNQHVSGEVKDEPLDEVKVEECPDSPNVCRFGDHPLVQCATVTPSTITLSPDSPSLKSHSPNSSSPTTPSPKSRSPVSPSIVTPSPVSPSPISPSPNSTSPNSPLPMSPSPNSPSPVSPSPVSRSPNSRSPVSPSPVSPSPVAPSPISPSPPDSISDSTTDLLYLTDQQETCTTMNFCSRSCENMIDVAFEDRELENTSFIDPLHFRISRHLW